MAVAVSLQNEFRPRLYSYFVGGFFNWHFLCDTLSFCYVTRTIFFPRMLPFVTICLMRPFYLWHSVFLVRTYNRIHNTFFIYILHAKVCFVFNFIALQRIMTMDVWSGVRSRFKSKHLFFKDCGLHLVCTLTIFFY